MNRRGFTLIEMVLAAFCGVLIFMAAGQVFSNVINSQKRNFNSTDIKAELVNVTQMIKRVGRAAMNCSRSGTVGLSVLQCTGTFFGTTEETVRFIVNNGRLEVQKQNGVSWDLLSNYPSITVLKVCGDTELANAAALCPQIQPAFPYPAADPVRASRYFRFQLTAASETDQVEMQSAFYVRNPGDLGAGITYLKGW